MPDCSMRERSERKHPAQPSSRASHNSRVRWRRTHRHGHARRHARRRTHARRETPRYVSNARRVWLSTLSQGSGDCHCRLMARVIYVTLFLDDEASEVKYFPGTQIASCLCEVRTFNEQWLMRPFHGGTTHSQPLLFCGAHIAGLKS